MANARDRIVITGMGVWCSVGRGVGKFEQALRDGRDGRAEIPLTRFDTSSPVYRTRTGAVLPAETFESLCAQDVTVLTQFGSEASEDALRDAGLDCGAASEEAGLCLGTTVGGGYAMIKFLKGKLGAPGGDLGALSRSCTPGSVAGGIADRLGLRGPVSVISTACAAGTNALGRARDLIHAGQATRMVAGGVDVFTELTFSGFNIMQLLARGPCRPFDAEHDGLMLGDAAAFMVLEPLALAQSRGARVYAEIAGYAIANEAFHPTGPDPEGAAAIRVMTEALDEAGLDPESLDYINTHGTGTRANDAMELKAICSLLGSRRNRVYLSSTKSMVGHTLGAAGSIEVLATALGIHRGFVPPTIHLGAPLAGYEDLNFVRGQAIDAGIRVALSNSFGFGGNVASIALRGIP